MPTKNYVMNDAASTRRTAPKLLVTALMLSAAPAALAQSADLTTFPGINQPISISRDGKVVVGIKTSVSVRAFRWTAAGGL